MRVLTCIVCINNAMSILTIGFLVEFVLSTEIGINGVVSDDDDSLVENVNLLEETQIFTTESIDLSTFEGVILDDENNEKANMTKKGDKPFLLPYFIKPVHYKLEIIPLLFPVEDKSSPYYNLSRFSAPGKVWIQIVCLEDTSNITLHAYQDIIIESKKIEVINIESSEKIPIKNVIRDNDTDFLLLELSQNIGSNSTQVYSIYIEFIARVADDRLNGIYLDYYIDPSSKEKRYLSTTLFAPNHARKAFPCFDEPGFKANFTVSIGRKNDSGYSSISNMPLANTKPIPELNGWVWDEFEETLPLPTYLVAIITTDFASRSVQDGDFELKLHAPEYLIKRIQTLNISLSESDVSRSPNPYLLQDPLLYISASLKMWKETKLGLYPMPKLDVIALPHFYFNAMENMGAITFKYPVILNVENVTTTSELLRLSFVAGHEVVHQWFGNMLTPKNWTYVWLKESFSDLFSRVFLSEKVNGAYNHEDFVNSELQRAMRFDSSQETHPLENHITSASAVGEIYTDIPYRKGASIMNMARHFLSHSVFKEGLESLFLEKKHSNIDQYDLFNHLEESQQKYNILKSQGLNANTTVTDILNSWTKQCGYPVIRVRKEGSRLLVKQEKYKNPLLTILKNEDNATNDELEDSTMTSLTPESKNDTRQNYWWIPVPLYKHVELTNKRHYLIKWLHPNNEEIEILLGGYFGITNVEGYFRILYEKRMLHSILKGLMRKYTSGTFKAYVNSDEIHSLQPVERSQLLDDYFTFAFSKYEEVPVSLLFHIVSVILPHEEDFVVWRTFFQNIQKPYKLFQNTTYFPLLQEFLRKLLQPLHSFLSAQKPTILSTPCFHSSVLTRRMYYFQFSSTVLSWICAIGSQTCAEEAKQNVQRFMKNEDLSTISADYQETTYCAAVKYATDQEVAVLWEFFEKMYFQEYFPVQRDRYLKALSCTRKRDYLLRLLSWTTNDTLDFHDVDRVTLLKNVITNPEGREIILNFLSSNFDALHKSASVANPVTEALKAHVEYINTNEKLQEFEAFITKHSEAMEKKKKFLEKQVNKAKYNILWMKTFAEDIRQSIQVNLKSTFSTYHPACSHESIPDIEEYIGAITDWSL